MEPERTREGSWDPILDIPRAGGVAAVLDSLRFRVGDAHIREVVFLLPGWPQTDSPCEVLAWGPVHYQHRPRVRYGGRSGQRNANGLTPLVLGRFHLYIAGIQILYPGERERLYL